MRVKYRFGRLSKPFFLSRPLFSLVITSQPSQRSIQSASKSYPISSPIFSKTESRIKMKHSVLSKLNAGPFQKNPYRLANIGCHRKPLHVYWKKGITHFTRKNRCSTPIIRMPRSMNRSPIDFPVCHEKCDLHASLGVRPISCCFGSNWRPIK